jgi:hypothetical protein
LLREIIPQILLSGLIGVPTGISKTAGLLLPATWSFDMIKRFLILDTLEEEGAKPYGENKGQGLYKFIETKNDKIIADAQRNLNDYRRESVTKLKDFHADL